MLDAHENPTASIRPITNFRIQNNYFKSSIYFFLFINFKQEAITLNVGGKRHEVRWDTLDKFPNSRLGRLRHSVSHRGKKFFIYTGLTD